MARNLSSHDERLLLSGVQQAVRLVDDDGYTPNDAIAKIARDMNFTPGMLKTACFAYNTGRQLAQWKTQDSVLDKLASFPLADHEAVSAIVFAPKAKTAAYIPPESVPLRKYESSFLALTEPKVKTEKVANDVAQKPVFAPQKAPSMAAVKQAEEQARTQKLAAEQTLERELLSLVRYFQKFAYDRKPFAQVEWFSRLRNPDYGAAVFDYLGVAFPKEKRAEAYPLTWEKFGEAVDYTAEPYTTVDRAVSAITAALDATNAYEDAQKQVRAAIEREYSPAADQLYPKPTIDTLLGTITVPGTDEKLASFGFTDALSFMAGRHLASRSQDDYAKKQHQVAEKAVEFDDPAHLNELRKIRAQTALSQLLSDPDDPLSEADPGHVLEAYNSLVHMAPRLADQPEALGPLLRKRIVGKQEPFEAAEVLKFEEGLRKVQPSLPSMPSANMFSGGSGGSNILG